MNLIQRLFNRRKNQSTLQTTEAKVDVSTEPIVAWRAWSFRKDGLLRPLCWDADTWQPRKPAAAWHMGRDGKCDIKECFSCGLWAMRSRNKLDSMTGAYYRKTECFGEVYLWGTVIECTDGYRAEYAYPKSLYVRGNVDVLTVMALEENYGVPVKILDTEKTETEHAIFIPRTAQPTASGYIYFNSLAGMMQYQSPQKNFFNALGALGAGVSGLIKP